MIINIVIIFITNILPLLVTPESLPQCSNFGHPETPNQSVTISFCFKKKTIMLNLNLDLFLI